jgi:glycosyltransferase involved in cell wall biosynthesis
MIEAFDAIVVGVPARNEAATIADCLRALVVAAELVDVAVEIVVAADGCRDDTAAIAESVVPGCVLRTDHRGAGAARAAAIDEGLRRRAGRDRVWVATTDADTLVHESWLATHLAWAGTGVDGIAGLVDVAWAPGQEQLAARYRESLTADGLSVGHRHVHGANLGLAAARWREVGGCGPLTVGEDRDLWDRLRSVGALLLGVDDLFVTTSGRLEGRTPAGFAGYLNDLVEEGDR